MRDVIKTLGAFAGMVIAGYIACMLLFLLLLGVIGAATAAPYDPNYGRTYDSEIRSTYEMPPIEYVLPAEVFGPLANQPTKEEMGVFRSLSHSLTYLNGLVLKLEERVKELERKQRRRK